MDYVKDLWGQREFQREFLPQIEEYFPISTYILIIINYIKMLQEN